ncbi:MAG: methyltransferase family protein [Anaerolineales bacterium]|jgi:protein-S-isoprenylcysteine O-methyltransferase Ste14
MKNKMLATSILWTLTAGGQMLAAWLLYDPAASSTRINLGWLVIFISGIFGWLPIFTFRSRGEVQGRSYVDTTVLVDSGVYSVVRHPQYLAGLLICIALPLITWHWLVILLGGASLGMYWWSAVVEEEQNLEKFGDSYRDYMGRVPRFNFLLGLGRLVKKAIREGGDGHKE